MNINLNKNISVWRGNNTPPTDYHLWVKDDGSILVKVLNLAGLDEWVSETGPYLDSSIKITTVTSLEEALQWLSTQSTIIPQPGTIIKFQENDKWVEYISIGKNYQSTDNWEIIGQLNVTVELQEQIDALQIVQIEPTDNEILTSYLLQDKNNTVHGVTINIPKDKSIKDVQVLDTNATIDDEGNLSAGDPVGTTALCIVYITLDGSYKLVKLDYSKFIEETEYGNGLTVQDHIISIKLNTNPQTSKYIDLDQNGLGIKGIDEEIEEHTTNITSDLISDGAITTNKIASGAVTNEKLATSSVTTGKINNNAITTDKLANNSVSTDKVIDGAITANKLADSVIKLNELPGEDETSIKTYELRINNIDQTLIGKIDIPKDLHLVDVKVSDTNATLDGSGLIVDGNPKGTTALVLSYYLEDGTYKIAKLDYQRFIEEAEIGNGLDIVDGKVVIKLDSSALTSKYLQVTDAGVGVKGIDEAINALDKSYITKYPNFSPESTQEDIDDILNGIDNFTEAVKSGKAIYYQSNMEDYPVDIYATSPYINVNIGTPLDGEANFISLTWSDGGIYEKVRLYKPENTWTVSDKQYKNYNFSEPYFIEEELLNLADGTDITNDLFGSSPEWYSVTDFILNHFAFNNKVVIVSNNYLYDTLITDYESDDGETQILYIHYKTDLTLPYFDTVKRIEISFSPVKAILYSNSTYATSTRGGYMSKESYIALTNSLKVDSTGLIRHNGTTLTNDEKDTTFKLLSRGLELLFKGNYIDQGRGPYSNYILFGRAAETFNINGNIILQRGSYQYNISACIYFAVSVTHGIPTTGVRREASFHILNNGSTIDGADTDSSILRFKILQVTVDGEEYIAGWIPDIMGGVINIYGIQSNAYKTSNITVVNTRDNTITDGDIICDKDVVYEIIGNGQLPNDFKDLAVFKGDLNDYHGDTYLGYYIAQGGSTPSNAPDGVSHFGLQVLRASGTNYAQILYAKGKIYYRNYTNSTWTSWVDLTKDTTYNNATTTAAGLMSAADKTKVNGALQTANAGVGVLAAYAIAAEKVAISPTDTINQAIGKLEKALNDLAGDGDGSVADLIQEAIATLVGGASEGYLTLKELEDAIKQGATNLTDLETRVEANEDKLATVLGEETIDGSIKKALKDAKDYTNSKLTWTILE